MNDAQAKIYDERQEAVRQFADRLFAIVMGSQWIFGIFLALTISPVAWVSMDSSTSFLVQALFLGGFFTLIPLAFIYAKPGHPRNAFIIAVFQMLMSGLLIHLTAGRTETHFHAFGSLAFLAFYRDWRVFVPATLVVAGDQLIRGSLFPKSVFGQMTSGPLEYLFGGSLGPVAMGTAEHVFWILFEVSFLAYACVLSQRDMKLQAGQQADLERLVGKLTNIVGEVQKAGINVTGAATAIAANSKQQESTIAQQAATATQISATAREISATSQQLVDTMGELANDSELTAELAAQGREALDQMSTVMNHIVEAASSVTEKLDVLSGRATRINKVVTTINRVADQTNLLSLNAAIEAERAKEHGRGFSVLATEIRRLADQTAVATMEIEETVKEMQNSVSSGVSSVENFTDELAGGSNELLLVVKRLGKIIGSVESMSERFEQVNHGMISQAEGAEQISDSIRQLSEVSQHSAEAVRESRSVIEQLKEATDSLQGSIQLYRSESRVA